MITLHHGLMLTNEMYFWYESLKPGWSVKKLLKLPGTLLYSPLFVIPLVDANWLLQPQLFPHLVATTKIVHVLSLNTTCSLLDLQGHLLEWNISRTGDTQMSKSKVRVVEDSVAMGFAITVILVIACQYGLECFVTFEVHVVSLIHLFSLSSSDPIMYFLWWCSVLYMSLEIQKSYHLPFLAMTLEGRLFNSYVKKAGFSLPYFRHSQIIW